MRKIFISCLLILLAGSMALAQLGGIRGRITDAQTGEPLPGANIFLLNTVYGAASDASGFYVIRNVVPGTYTLVAKYVGYQEFRQTVTLMPGDMVVVDIRLTRSPLFPTFAQQQELSGSMFWKQNCGRCHNARGVNEFNNVQWDVVLRHMRIIGNIPGDQARAILKFLQNANNPPEEEVNIDEEVKGNVGRRIERAGLSSRSKFLISGYGAVSSIFEEGRTPRFVVSFFPLLHSAIGDKGYFLFKSAISVQEIGGGTETAAEVEIAQLSIFLNDYLTLVAGKFILPFNVYPERFYPLWINKLPGSPIIYTQTLSSMGVQLRGGTFLPSSKGSKINYSFYFIEGSNLRIGETVGGRLGILPVWNLELGSSIISEINGNFRAVGFDGKFNLGGLDLRGEFVNSEPGWLGWGKWGFYIQGSYRLPGGGTLSRLEPVVRYEKISNEDLLAVGINYWIEPSSAFKIAYAEPLMWRYWWDEWWHHASLFLQIVLGL